jgi:signal transduction histidine kinase
MADPSTRAAVSGPGADRPGSPHRRRRAAVPLRRWVWRNLAAATLIPVMLVELGLLGAYAVSHGVNNSENVATVRKLATEQLTTIAALEAEVIDTALRGVERQLRQFRDRTARAHATPIPAERATAERARYRRHASGAVFTPPGVEGASVFYSAIDRVTEADLAKAARLSRIDPFMAELAESNGLITQVYYNTRDSMNRIYPPIDVLRQYTPRLDIPELNFYYLADARHNPDRGAVWTDVYVDPAGQGWLTSAIAPVYRDGVLESVVGIDITIDRLRQQVLSLDVPWGGYPLLVNAQGTIMAMPETAEADWGLDELTDHAYETYVTEDRFKPARFNLFQRPEFRDLDGRLAAGGTGIAEVELGEAKLMSWAEIPATGWSLVVLVPKARVFAEAKEMSARSWAVFAILLALLVAFYAGFFTYLYLRAKRLTAEIARPLAEVDRMVTQISAGSYRVEPPRLEIGELQDTARRLARMGDVLEARTDSLKRALAEKDAANRAKAEFLANMSHELRTPLNAILGYSEMMKGEMLGPLGSRRYAEYAEDIHASGTHLLELVNDVLDLSKIDADRFELEEEWLAPDAVAGRCLSIVRPQAGDKGLELTSAVDAERALLADARALKQILLNLLSNAVKFTPEGGRIAMSGTAEVDGGYRFAVADTGPGMAEEDIPRALSRFEQLDGARSESAPGTGLGLPLSASLAELHGGRLTVASAPGRGTTVCLRLPPARVAAARPAPPPHRAAG